MNSDIIFTDTDRAIDQTKGREEMGRESKIKKPEKKSQRNEKDGADSSWNNRAFYYNNGRADMDKFRKQELTELADVGNIKETLLSIYDMEGGTALDIAKEISAMIKEKL